MNRLAALLFAAGTSGVLVSAAEWFGPASWTGLVILFGVAAAGALLLPTASLRPVGRAGLALALAAAVLGLLLLPAAWSPWVWSLFGVVGCAALPARFGRAARLLAEVLALQAIVLMVLHLVCGRIHELPGIGALLEGLLRLLGESAAWSDGRLTVQTSEGLMRVRPTAELLQLPILLPAWLAWVWSAARMGAGRGALLGTTLVLALWAILRAALVVLVCLNLGYVRPAWSVWFSLVSLAPAFLLVPWPVRREPEEREPCPLGWRPRVAAVGAVLLALGAVVLAHLSQFGAARPGRVVIHEHNSAWESTLREPGRDWFGPRAEYTFYGLRKLLADYHETEVSTVPLSDRSLEDVGVLILKTPTAAYAPDEVAAVLRFVERGGGLLLVGEHTNVFGMSHYLNAIAEPLGLRFRYDSQHSLVDYGLVTHRQARLAAHPILFDTPVFLFGTGCTLEPDLLAEDVILAAANTTAPADYSVSNFFSYDKPQLDRLFGVASQAAAACHGAGRAVAFTDSTVWSNFWVTMPAKAELLLGMIEWLQHRNVGPHVKVMGWLLLAAGLVLLLVAGASSAVGPALWLTTPLALLAVDALNRAGYRLPEPRTAPQEVVFSREGMDYFLPRVRLVPPEDRPRLPALSSFFAQPLRVGLYARETQTLGAALEREPRLMVCFNPTWELAAAQRDALRDYVERGGRLLILTCGASEAAAVVPLLATFDLALAEAATAGPIHDSRAGPGQQAVFEALDPFEAATLRGGRALLASADGPVAVQADVGRGSVVVSTLGDLLQDSYFGTDNRVPTLEQLRVYRFAFWLLRGLWDLEPGGRLGAVPSLTEEFGDDFAERIERYRTAAGK